MEMQIEIYLICVFLFLVARLMANHHSHCQLLEKYYNRKLAWISLPLSLSLAHTLQIHWLLHSIGSIWFWIFISVMMPTPLIIELNWISESFEYNSTSIHICKVTVESVRWIKHKWTRECHKNQSLETTRTHTHTTSVCLAHFFRSQHLTFILSIWPPSYMSISQFSKRKISLFLNLVTLIICWR